MKWSFERATGVTGKVILIYVNSEEVVEFKHEYAEDLFTVFAAGVMKRGDSLYDIENERYLIGTIEELRP